MHKMVKICELSTDTEAQIVRTATHYADVLGSNPNSVFYLILGRIKNV